MCSKEDALVFAIKHAFNLRAARILFCNLGYINGDAIDTALTSTFKALEVPRAERFTVRGTMYLNDALMYLLTVIEDVSELEFVLAILDELSGDDTCAGVLVRARTQYRHMLPKHSRIAA